MTTPQRILIIKPSSLGDVTHALPVLHLLRKRWPNAKISWLVAPYCSGLLEGHPDLDEVILFDRRRFGTAWKNPSAGLDLIRFKRDLRHRNFDWVIDLQGLFRSGWLAWFTRAPAVLGGALLGALGAAVAIVAAAALVHPLHAGATEPQLS